MDEQTIAMGAAAIAVVATVIYLVLGFIGIRTLKDIRDRMRGRDEE